MLVGEIISSGVEIIEPGMPVREAGRRMRALDVGALIVSHIFDLHGVITGRDLVVRVMAQDIDPVATPVLPKVSGPH